MFCNGINGHSSNANLKDNSTRGKNGIPSAGSSVVEVEEAKNFVIKCLMKIGCEKNQAESLGDLLSIADYRGHISHGLIRLGIYVEDILSGATSKAGFPIVRNETEAIAWVDGQNLLGPYSAMFCMNLAIDKAAVTGVGLVCCKNANHFGIAGYYSLMASERGMIGMTFCNTAPCHTPTNGTEILLGSNPLAMHAPSINGDYFGLDMATSTVAYGKVEICKMEGKEVPLGWGTNARGELTRSADEILNGGSVLPLGGTEETAGYKGYGLCTMVEILTGILGGGDYGPNIKKWSDKSRPANLGHCFIAINPGMFEPGFPNRLADLMAILRTSKPMKGKDKVLVAGDPERIHMKEADDREGILYHPNILSKLNVLADQLEVTRIKTKTTSQQN